MRDDRIVAVAARQGDGIDGLTDRANLVELDQDRITKYNQLLRIEEELGDAARFLGLSAVNYHGELAGKAGA